jgi:hypothetical protein
LRRAAGRAVSDSAHGPDEARCGRIVSKLAPQPPYVDIDGPVEHVCLASPVDGVEELLAAEDPAARLHQRGQDLELDSRQVGATAVDDDVVPVSVDAQAFHPKHLVAVRLAVVVENVQQTTNTEHELRR